jgi:L-ascorbate metabolism protein UlaG (beta-lactamase superfamily)
MKVTKYAHSCLLVEDENIYVLIDPGIYSEQFEDKLLSLSKLDFILITHDHFDHFSIPLIKALSTKFPDVIIVGTQSVKEKLLQENIDVQNEPNNLIHYADSPHEKMFFKGPMAENIAFTIFDKLTHPGDSFQFSQTAIILALPVVAPWGSSVQAFTKALQVKPKIIIPIHDAMMKDEAIQSFLYPSLTKVFSEEGIEFKGLRSGETTEV